jgi:hypothetical protein
LVAPFSVDFANQILRIGSGTGANATLSMYASDGSTGSLVYNTNDQFQFTGGDVLVDNNLSVTGTINTNTFTGTALTFSGENPVISPSTENSSISFVSNAAGSLTLDSGTTGAVNLGTGNNTKTVNIATGTGGNVINLATDNTTADTINIGSALDTINLTGTTNIVGPANINATGNANTVIGNSTGTFELASNGGLNVTTGGALTGVSIN